MKMKMQLQPIRTEADYRAALKDAEALLTLIDAYERKHYPVDPPDPVDRHQLSDGRGR